MKNKRSGNHTNDSKNKNKNKKKISVQRPKSGPKTRASTKSRLKNKMRTPTTPAVEPATLVKACNETPTKCVPVLIRTKFYGKLMETAQTLQVPMIDKDMIRLDLTINLRMSEAILIEPVRRDMDDVVGMLGDAESIANERR